MAAALGAPLKDAPAASGAMLSQVDRAVTETLEHHAHVRLRSVA
jgi:DNA repair protein RecO (recombination protein O)